MMPRVKIFEEFLTRFVEVRPLSDGESTFEGGTTEVKQVNTAAFVKVSKPTDVSLESLSSNSVSSTLSE